MGGPEMGLPMQGRAATSLLTKTCVWWPLPAQHLLCSLNFVSSTHLWVPLHNHPFENPQDSTWRTTDCVTKVSPYTEIRKLEFLCEDIGDKLLCLRNVRPHTFSPWARCVSRQMNRLLTHKALCRVQQTLVWNHTHIAPSSWVSRFSLLIVFTGLIRSYALENDIQPTSDSRLARKN